MNLKHFYCILHAAFFSIQVFQITVHGVDASSKLYIVYLGEKNHNDPEFVTASHHEKLTPLFRSKEEAVNSIVYSYKHGFSGFAAMLNKSQAQILSDMPDVISVTPSRKFAVHTTRSWDFLGLDYSSQSNGLLQKGNYGEDIIIGVVDTGIWPESKSFEDIGYGPPPTQWRGTCQTSESFGASNCSNKIIGARWYASDLSSSELKGEYMSARDLNGHGTHCASTAAGNIVSNTSFFGLAAGSVRGGAPRARLAIYKVCWGDLNTVCSDAGILAAIDDAINDGVHILSISIGGPDEISGTLHAVAKGITVVFAAGNNGPAPQSVQNNAPWVISVAASTIDRFFPTVITLGNGQKLVGQSIFVETLQSNTNNFALLVDGWSCDNITLSKLNVTNKIVLCYDPTAVAKILPRNNFNEAVGNVFNAGGVGLIYAQYTVNIITPLRIPFALVDFEIANKIYSYISSTSIPQVKISSPHSIQGIQVLAPRVAAFSSRGPNPTFPGILKPDIAAPGVSILAAVNVGYEFKDGTSMACPHVTGIAALLKFVHPDWSPAVIKSAIVTTASVFDAYGVQIEAEATPRKTADPFDYGGGHIDPNKAVDPGLVYDIDPNNYTKFFNCTLSPSDECDSYVGQLYQLNVPSVVVPNLKDTISVWRTVTNVGPSNSTYKAFVQPPAGINVFVEPKLLSFDSNNKENIFKTTFVANRKVQGDYTFGSLTWSDGLNHSVRIPLAIRTIIQEFYADTS
ncbi:Subtilisin-like protease SBT3.6 [Rhynchospora pubera]|uniref:Subtilisin-like protease SBT3.6 n=1 Tax=Rhynchospora pubera TaxID=906938 RepID=A0AAV8H7V1_9POAL|nr:Subtilisin-like protease SBT3.6 [Rhynchospora pubera]